MPSSSLPYQNLPLNVRLRMHRSLETPDLQSLHVAQSTSQTPDTNASASLAFRNRVTNATKREMQKDLRKAIVTALGATKYHKAQLRVANSLKLQERGWQRFDRRLAGMDHTTMTKEIGPYTVILSPWDGVYLYGVVRIESRAGLILQFPTVLVQGESKLEYWMALKPNSEPRAKIEMELAREILEQEGFGPGVESEPFRVHSTGHKNFRSPVLSFQNIYK